MITFKIGDVIVLNHDSENTEPMTVDYVVHPDERHDGRPGVCAIWFDVDGKIQRQCFDLDMVAKVKVAAP